MPGTRPIPTVLVSIEDSRAYGRGLLRGISQYARIHGPWLFITRPDFYHGGRSNGNLFYHLTEGDIDGVIMREMRGKDMLKALERNVPIVVASHLTLETTLPFIVTDCEMIGRMGAQHFLDRGFQHLAYCGMGDVFWSERRQKGFTKAVMQAGCKIHVYPLPRTKRNRAWSKEQAIIAKWLRQLPKPVAVMACTDDRARDVVEACQLAGLPVPEEVAVLGVDNDELVCDLAGVPISSVALNLQKAGYESAELLDGLMKRRKVGKRQVVVSPTHVEVRRSSDVFAVEDPHVAKALNFINNHVNEPLQVSDVARAMALSERHLYDRFQQTLGWSVGKQIVMMRTARICWLLENTKLSVREVALAMGLPGDSHLARYFERQKGVGPTEWRKQCLQSSPG